MALKNIRESTNAVASYRNAKGETTNAIVIAAQPAPPGVPGISTSTSGGTLAAATYSYRITRVILGKESGPSTAVTQATTGTTSTVTIDWTAIADPSATAYKVYGRTGGSELLMGTVNMPTKTFTDTGAVTPAGALPANDGKADLLLPHTNQVLTNVVRATGMKQTNVYFNRY